MDVQTDNMDPPPPCESQSRGKIRKGFKLFGKRKPGNIFSLRSKKDDNGTASSPLPAIRSNGADGLPPDSEPEREKENGREASRGAREPAEDELLDGDGVPTANAAAAAAARASVSSAGSAKSLGFLSLLRGGRRGTEDRRVRAASKPAGRRRRGLKGLFGSVKFRSKDKEEDDEEEEEEEEAPPPSPLLMSSRADSVEIIKEDLPLTPEAHRRSLDSLEIESRAPDERPPPFPTSGPPLEPGENSLSCLLADISSLLTFDSITGGGDIMADVEAEWGKASSPVGGLAAPPTSYASKPLISTPTTSFSVGTAAKPSPVAVPTTASTRPLAATTTTTSAHAVVATSNPSRDSPPLGDAAPPPGVTIKSTEPSTAASTSTDLPARFTSLPSPSSTSPATAAPPDTPAAGAEAPPVSSTLRNPSPEVAAPPPALTSVSKPVSVAAPTPGPAPPPPVTRRPVAPVAFAQPPSAELDSPNYLNLQPSASYKPSLSLAAGDSKPPVPSSSAPVPPSKAPATPSGSVPTALSKPTLTSSPMDSDETPPPPASAPDKYPSSPQPCSASVPTPSSFSFDRIPPVTKLIPAPASLGKTAPVPTPAPPPSTRPTPPAHIPVSPSKAPPAPAHITSSGSKDPFAQMQVSQTKAPPVSPQIPIHESNDLPAPVEMKVPQSKAPPPPAQIPISVSKDPFAQMQVPQSKAPPPPAQIPVCISPGLPALVPNPVSSSQDPPRPITLSQSKAPPPSPSPSPSPVTSPLSPPWWSEAPASAKAIGPSGACAPGGRGAALSEESRTSLQGQSRERRLPQAKASGPSKIPVVGGGRAVKPPARDGHHVDDEACRAPPTTPVLEEEERPPRFPSHDSGSRDKLCDVEASKHSREESQQLPKVLSGVPRDSKIPVKSPPQAASHIPLPCRTKIPVSKVPVRRAGNKPAAQVRK